MLTNYYLEMLASSQKTQVTPTMTIFLWNYYFNSQDSQKKTGYKEWAVTFV